jgi:hypothetical protein
MTCHPPSHLPAEAIRRESEPDDASGAAAPRALHGAADPLFRQVGTPAAAMVEPRWNRHRVSLLACQTEARRSKGQVSHAPAPPRPAGHPPPQAWRGTPSLAVGGSWPPSLWRWPIAAARRDYPVRHPKRTRTLFGSTISISPSRGAAR